MAINTYQLGDAVRVKGVFTDNAGVAHDPSTVKCSYRPPGGSVVTLIYPTTIVQSSTGNYYLDISANAVGSWTYRWHSEGTGQAADENVFKVEASDFD